MQRIRGVLQKFCVAQPFSTCGNSVMLKLLARVLKVFQEHVPNFVATGLKLCGDKKNNNGGNTERDAHDGQ